VDIIVATGTKTRLRCGHEGDKTIPIVRTSVDPVSTGLSPAWRAPGG